MRDICVNPAPSAPTSQRDVRLDFFRGLALIFIFIDHVPGNALGYMTMRAFGLADAAEAFVLIAGFTAVMAYGSTFEREGWGAGARRVGRRVVELYAAQLLLVAACALLLAGAARWFENPLYYEHVNLTPFAYDPWGAIWRNLVLYYQLGYINILPLYMVLLAWFPALVWLMRRNAWAGLGLSVAVWAAAAWWRINLPSWPEVYGWYFNPLTWQVIFAIGAFTAVRRRQGATLSRAPWLVGLAAAYVAFCLVFAAPWIKIPGLGLGRIIPFDFVGPISKVYVSPFRLAHILALAYLIAVLLPAGAAWLRARPAQLVIDCGRNSLDIFCLATLLSFVGFIVMLEAGRTWPFQALVNVAGVGMLLAAGRALTRAKVARGRKADVPVPAAGAPSQVTTGPGPRRAQ